MIEPLFIPKTDISPEIVFDHDAALFSIRGESRPEYPQKFYRGAFDWFDAYFSALLHSVDSKPIDLQIDFDYFNSTSAKIIYDFLTRLREGMEQTGTKVHVTWCYDKFDDDMLHSGKELEHLTRLSFRFEAR